jgi:hypothetical protein
VGLRLDRIAARRVVGASKPQPALSFVPMHEPPASCRNQITEIDLQIIEVDRKASFEAHKEIREIDARIDELSDRRLTVEAQLAKVATSQHKFPPE